MDAIPARRRVAALLRRPLGPHPHLLIAHDLGGCVLLRGSECTRVDIPPPRCLTNTLLSVTPATVAPFDVFVVESAPVWKGRADVQVNGSDLRKSLTLLNFGRVRFQLRDGTLPLFPDVWDLIEAQDKITHPSHGH
jgi:hypothetical protein